MKRVELATTGRTATRLGFGCSSIMGSMGRKESLRTLEWAYDAGVRHFDVAPMYGYGMAEGCLGEFLALHPGELTVTTKFGIPPASNPGLIGIARRFASPIVKAIPGLKKRVQRAASTVAAAPQKRDLSVATAQQSLEKSLRELRVERIDVFLLHDVTPQEVSGSPLLEFLEGAKQKGSIGAYGVGTERAHVDAIRQQSPAYAQVAQNEWSVFNPLDKGDAFHIHHRALAENYERLTEYIESSPAVAKQWSDEIGDDVSDSLVLSRLMMRAALRANPKGIVLFSSKSHEHILENALHAVPSEEKDSQAGKFYAIVQRDLASIPQETAS